MLNNSFSMALFILLFLFSFNQCLFSQNENDSLAGIVDNYIIERMKEGNIPGLGCIIVKDSGVITRVYGYSDLEAKDLVSSQTLFELGSTSKAFTALAILKLEKEKKIRLR